MGSVPRGILTTKANNHTCHFISITAYYPIGIYIAIAFYSLMDSSKYDLKNI